jgi:putative aldouronate transport system substrate-binding protein
MIIKNYFDIAPNIKKFFESYPEAIAMATGSDGGIYSVPIMGGDPGGTIFSYAW